MVLSSSGIADGTHATSAWSLGAELGLRHPGPELANYIGFAGMACIIAAYAYQTARDAPNPFVQHGTNLLGAALLTVSLLVYTNLASLVLEGFWAAIAIYGLVRAVRARRPADQEGPAQ
ncbi:Putative permease [Pelagerythrobacter marensis]|uniref:Putative permease n=1 Tax=Pelagerythrobacter marensis TaxID=543877 RepID=A0A0G3X5C4_9SPHN|nr:Putative permease [Pelagerythrobacter marensis]